MAGRNTSEKVNPNQNRTATVEVGAADFDAEVLRSDRPVLVAFWAPWSRPCHILDTALENVAAACVGKVKVAKVNADDHPDLGLLYEIQAVPTLLYIIDGDLRARVVGTASTEAILAKLRAVFPDEATRSLTADPNQKDEHHSA